MNTPPINLNTATADELRSLPGVGPALARAILSDRGAAGEYASVEDLRRVPGVGPKLMARIVGLVAVGGVAAAAATALPSKPKAATHTAAQPANDDATPEAALAAVEAVWSSREDNEEIRPPGPGLAWTAGQIAAIKAIRWHLRNKRGEIFVLRGYAGTGKTTLLVEALRPFVAPSMLAPTHKAKAILAPKADLLGGEASTVHRWLGYACILNEETGEEEFRRAARDPKYDPNPRTPVVIDEVSMIGVEMWAEITHEVKRFGLMCIAMGDPLQLPPVGEDTSPAFRVSSGVELTEVMRSQGALTGVVLGVRERIHSPHPPLATRDVEDAKGRVNVIDCKIGLLRDYFAAIQGGRDAIILAWTNRIVDWANGWIRAQIAGDSSLPFVVGEVLVVTDPYRLDEGRAAKLGEGPTTRPMLYTESRLRVISAEIGRHPRWDDACWILKVQRLGFGASPRPIEDSANDEETDEETGDELGVEVVYALDLGQRKAWLDRLRNIREKFDRFRGLAASGNKDARRIQGDLARELSAYRGAYLKARPGYATTVHKSQGSTWDDVYVIQGDIAKNDKAFERNRLLYVAFSRAAKRLAVYG